MKKDTKKAGEESTSQPVMRKTNIGLLIVQIILLITATLMAISSAVVEIPGLPPGFAMWWPVALPIIALADRITRLIADLMDDGEMNDSYKDKR